MSERGATRDAPDRQRLRAGTLVAAELGILALSLGTAASFNRLFVGWSFLAELAVPLVACWATSVALRRLRVGVGPAALVSMAVAVLVLTWRFAPGTSFLGVPTGESLRTAGSALESSFGDFRRLVAPVPASDGFLLVLAAALWVFGTFADAAAFRYRAPVQAAIPFTAAFVATGVLARDPGRLAAAVWFGAGLAAYATTQRTWQAAGRRWVPGEAARGTRSVLATSATVALVALAAGLVGGPRLPGGDDAVVDLRDVGRGAGSRTVVSPFVSVRSLLGPRSDQVVFTVASDRPAYWRLTALERYDPGQDIWTSRRSYQRAAGSLGQQGPQPPGLADVGQSFRIGALGGLWLPAAFRPVRLDTEEDVSWDPASQSLIARGDSLRTGAEYRVVSDLVAPTPDDLAGPADGRSLDPAYTEDPGLSGDVLRAAQVATASARTPYEQALELQRFFRQQFLYDETVDFRGAADPTAAFLAERRGFCQQFASTFALMARSLGLPARVAVGFTPGDPVVATGDAAPGGVDSGADRGPGFVVRGRHAHAWPEVFFDGVGWVPFEPTPGRGNPQATPWTGVPAQQAEPPADEPTATTAAPTTVATGAATTQPTPGTDAVDASGAPRAASDGAGGDGGGAWPWLLVTALGLVAAVALLGRRQLSRRDRRARRREGGGRVAAAWDTAVAGLAPLGWRPHAWETPVEFAARVAGDPDGPGVDAELADLARWETARRFGPEPLDDAAAAGAEAASATVAERARELRQQGGRRRRAGQADRVGQTVG